MPIVTELGQLIDCSEEEFRKFCEDKDLGYLSSFHNLMVQTFNDVYGIKRELVSKICEGNKNGKQMSDEQSTLQGLYSKLMKIEHRVFILRELIKQRQLQ